MKLDAESIVKQAKQEHDEELFREAVELHKAKLREKKSLWDTLFPYKIIIVRK